MTEIDPKIQSSESIHLQHEPSISPDKNLEKVGSEAREGAISAQTWEVGKRPENSQGDYVLMPTNGGSAFVSDPSRRHIAKQQQLKEMNANFSSRAAYASVEEWAKIQKDFKGEQKQKVSEGENKEAQAPDEGGVRSRSGDQENLDTLLGEIESQSKPNTEEDLDITQDDELAELYQKREREYLERASKHLLEELEGVLEAEDLDTLLKGIDSESKPNIVKEQDITQDDELAELYQKREREYLEGTPKRLFEELGGELEAESREKANPAATQQSETLERKGTIFSEMLLTPVSEEDKAKIDAAKSNASSTLNKGLEELTSKVSAKIDSDKFDDYIEMNFSKGKEVTAIIDKINKSNNEVDIKLLLSEGEKIIAEGEKIIDDTLSSGQIPSPEVPQQQAPERSKPSFSEALKEGMRVGLFSALSVLTLNLGSLAKPKESIRDLGKRIFGKSAKTNDNGGAQVESPSTQKSEKKESLFGRLNLSNESQKKLRDIGKTASRILKTMKPQNSPMEEVKSTRQWNEKQAEKTKKAEAKFVTTKDTAKNNVNDLVDTLKANSNTKHKEFIALLKKTPPEVVLRSETEVKLVLDEDAKANLIMEVSILHGTYEQKVTEAHKAFVAELEKANTEPDIKTARKKFDKKVENAESERKDAKEALINANLLPIDLENEKHRLYLKKQFG